LVNNAVDFLYPLADTGKWKQAKIIAEK